MKDFLRLAKTEITQLITLGIDSSLPILEEKYVRLSNIIALLTFGSIIAYIPYIFFIGNALFASILLINSDVVLGVLLLNQHKYYHSARIFYIFSVNTLILVTACFIGFESRVSDFFYVSYIIPFLLFSVKDFKNILFGVLVSIGFFGLYQQVYPLFTSYNLPYQVQHQIYLINLWLKFLMVGLDIYILSLFSFNAEKLLAQANQDLAVNAQALKQSNEDLEQFASIISHDLKAPVKNVSAFMGLLQDGYAHMLPATANQLITHSKISTDRMAHQIDDLLSYSKVDKNLPEATQVDLNEIVHIIKIELSEKMREKNALVTVIGTLPILNHSHNSMVHHVLQNLISNGIKFNTREHPMITIQSETLDSAYKITVKDNGIGIEERYRNKLFHMFKRLHSDTEFEGTGIGLAVCKKIINFYGGEVGFESEIDRGTTFYFTIPQKATKTAIQQPAAPAGHSYQMSTELAAGY